jgi:two-component system LytT family sensor kinase
MAELAENTLVVDALTEAEAESLNGRGVWKRRARDFAILCGVWAIPGIIGGLSLRLLTVGPGELPRIGLERALVWQLLAWLPWAMWTALAIWLVRRLPFTRKTWPFALFIHLLACVAIGSIQILSVVLLDRMFWPAPMTSPLGDHIRDAFFRLADFFVVIYMAIIVAGLGVDYFRRFREQQVAAERLRTEMVQAQLLALRSQLNPHFLFNALNSVISLMDRDVPAAQRMVARLGDLLRLSLNATETEVSLERELALVKQYLEIERIRFGDRLTFTVDVPRDLLDLPVPNLVLQPLVENAIVHGVGPRPGPGRVTVQAHQMGDTLLLRVLDDGLGLDRADSNVGFGIGVGNTRARLAAIYGATASLTLREAEWGGCIAEIRLPVATA